MPFDKSKFVYIDIDKVPDVRRRALWDEIFDSISPGKALVVREGEKGFHSIRPALRDRQKRGLYKDYYVTSRKDKESKVIYVARKRN